MRYLRVEKGKICDTMYVGSNPIATMTLRIHAYAYVALNNPKLG